MQVRITPAKAWSLVGLLAIVLMMLVLAWDLMNPKTDPVQAGIAEMERNTLIQKEIVKLRGISVAADAEYRKLLWQGTQDDIAPAALARIDHLARINGVRRIAFRPQRVETEAGLTKIPYALSLEGSYPSVLTFLQDLETPSNRLAVDLVQLASSDAANDTVSATIGVVAFQEVAEPEKPNGSK